ncbi:type IV pilin N-terminal domain-containing protein [Halorussus lipolyticus]|uniref:type IV pilin N-terminal domain-containing protein n=1 Tax=Halorussus lipolyticus TaxID=3034024 RepID=UPI0023E75D0E|nr:type IV pilin N-terminal domain-containing protein [Halorussus sp. DT80]
MNLKQLLHDDDAVSPVIGVILMVAITVILAAVIGTFVLGLGQNVQQSSPTASISFDQSGAGNSADVTISHDSGDPLKQGNIEVMVDGSPEGVASSWASKSSPNDKVTAGESINIPSGSLNGDSVIKVVWTADGGESSNVLGEYEVE